MKEIIVDKKYDGKKLNSFLLDSFDGLKLNTLYKALRKKDVRVNDTRISDNVIIHSGDVIKIFIPDEQLFSKNNFNIDIIYEYYNISSIFPCHRLDRNTIGLVLFAKNEEALNILLDKFKNREIEKHYKALVYGIPRKKEDTLTAYLFKDAKKSLVYISDVPKKGYEKIITSYKVISCNNKNNTSLLDVNLHTGKTHQIRAHLAHIGYPIIGDGKYGDREINKKFGYKYQQLCSRSLRFCFKTDAGILNYLNNKNVSI